ncbi:glycosyltransferase family 2 protein [Sphingomonas immobilis]|uniref:Glycosyltransferase n=1 Tax=Sphingomonas immobilis TaxID=3063997 RepID=A0ABT9A467_9SPHN|nr:glycosyltransferase [Sphingomonas sp. CA1-15]MDO7844633.1 glycosyltransferase [Sphingomonas sp. CA1-15]
MATPPTISVLMAIYNGASLVPETIASLQAQTFTDWELIVVDDCSADDSIAVVEAIGDSRIRVTRQAENGGVVLARNAAFAQARGRYIAALDHDDLCKPTRFAKQVAYLDTNPETVLLGTAADILDDGAILPPTLAPVTTPSVIEWLLKIENPLVWSSVMMRADAARAMGVFMRPELICAEDYDLYHRIARHGTIARLDEELMTYRRVRGSLSQSRADEVRACAIRVLADAHRPDFGDAADEMAELVTLYIMRQQPIPDRATLQRLGETLVKLQTHFIETRRPDALSRKLLRWETARRWARVGRIGLRTGALGLIETASVRPDHLGLGYASFDELILSRIVGGMRNTVRRVA